jgi:Fic family protein
MFTPTYSITPAILSEITQIERLYGQIEALQIPEQLEINLTRNNLIQSSYASNKIEGNPLTLPEVTNLLLDDRVPVNRSEKEVVNYFDILKSLSSYTDKPITTQLLKDIHKQLLEGVDKTAGSIRNVPVVVGKYSGEEGNVTLKVKHNPPFHTEQEITKSLEELFEWANTDTETPVVLKTGIFHHQFVYVHPFEDGNGRTCRILTALLFLKHNYKINRYFILDDYYDIDRHQYSDSLHSADSNDKTIWLTYFAEGVKHSMTSALFRLKEAVKTLPVKNRPTEKEQQVLQLLQNQQEIISQDVAANLNVSRQQAHNLLSSLVEKGFLTKEGSTKSSYYKLK